MPLSAAISMYDITHVAHAMSRAPSGPADRNTYIVALLMYEPIMLLTYSRAPSTCQLHPHGSIYVWQQSSTS